MSSADGDRDAGVLTDAGDDASRRDAFVSPDAGYDRSPLEAPREFWTYLPIEGARCGNGGEYGVAINLTDRSDRVVLFMQGGGACWDAATCFTMRTAAYFGSGIDEGIVLSDAQTSTSFVLSRDAQNPFSDASFVYMPYCTGDLHAGRRLADYGGQPGHHFGAENLDRVLARMTTTFETPASITLIGVSAGGYGVTLNWWRVAQAFPEVRVDVLADSSPMLDVEPLRWPAWRDQWALEFPPGCANCADGLSAVMPHYARAMPSTWRHGLLAYREDQVIGAFFGYTAPEVAARIDALRVAAQSTDAQRSFVVAGDSHVLLAMPLLETSAGLSAYQWIQRFDADDDTWDDAGP